MRRHFVIAVVLVGGCSGDLHPTGDGTLLRVGTSSVITEPGPLATDGLSTSIAELLYRCLVRMDIAGKPEGQLADSWSWSRDGKTLTLRLRPNVVYSDGTPVTAQQVVETYSRGVASHRFGFEGIDEIRAVDETALEMKVARPFRLPYALAYGVARGDPPIGAGAYSVATRDANHLVLHSNPLFGVGQTNIKTIEFRRFEKASEEWSRLLAREIDLITFVPWDKHEFLKTIPTIREVSSLSQTVAVIDIRNAPPPLDRPEVRYALSLAIDRGALVADALRGHGEPAHGVVWPRSEDFDPALPDYPYDPQEAVRILLSNGFRQAPSGKLLWEGNPFVVTFHYWNGSAELEDLALYLEKQLSDIGIGVGVVGHSMEEIVKLWWTGRPLMVLRFRHAAKDPIVEAGRDDMPQPSSLEELHSLVKLVQRRMRDEPPPTYLLCQERLDIIDTRFCGLPALPDGPESALNLVHLCAPGELN